MLFHHLVFMVIVMLIVTIFDWCFHMKVKTTLTILLLTNFIFRQIWYHLC